MLQWTSAVTREDFNTLGYLTQVTNPLNQAMTYSGYNGYGQPLRVVDINGIATDITYNPRGSATSTITTLPNGARSVNVSYSGWGAPSSVQRSGLGTLGYAYNSAGRLIQSSFAGDAVSYGFDPVSRTSTTSAPRHAPGFSGSIPYAVGAGNFVFTRVADSLGRLMRTVGNNGQQTTYTYDNNGNVKTVTDAANRVTSYSYDVLNRPVLVKLPDNATIRTDYDADGNVWKVTDPRSLVTAYAYNGFGELTSVSSPDSGATSYIYDSGGRRTGETRANGTSISYGYDLLSRMTSRSSGGVTESYFYDEGTYGKGRLTRVSDSTGQTTFAYTAAGELTQQVNTISGSAYTTSWSYDAAGRVTGMSYPSGLSLAYGYDTYGRVASVTSNLGGSWGTLASNFLYQPASASRYAWLFGNGRGQGYTQDADGRVTAIASPGVQSLSYGYHTTNTVQAITDGVWGLSSSMTYNAVDRVASVTRSADDQSFA